MNNKYKMAFSQIHPSEEVIERIFEMSERKNKKIKFKSLIIAAACLVTLLCGTITANAATDGALFDGFQLMINGEEVNLTDYIKNHKSYTDKDGNEVEEFEYEVPNEDDGGTTIYSFELEKQS